MRSVRLCLLLVRDCGLSRNPAHCASFASSYESNNRDNDRGCGAGSDPP